MVCVCVCVRLHVREGCVREGVVCLSKCVYTYVSEGVNVEEEKI